MSYKHVRLYCDTEFNSGGGELISVGMTSAQGKHWYGACETETVLEEWPERHVIPVLGIPQVSFHEMAESLTQFLSQFDMVTLVIDKKDDAKHLARLIEWQGYPSQLIQFEFVKPNVGIKHLSKIPHNALSDAEAYMELLLGSKEPDSHGVAPWDVYSLLDARGVGLNTMNSRYDFVTTTDTGDAIVEVYPVSPGGNHKRKVRFKDWDDTVGVYRLQIASR